MHESDGRPSFGSLLWRARRRVLPAAVVFLVAALLLAAQDPMAAAVVLVAGVTITLAGMAIAYRRVIGNGDVWAQTREGLAALRRNEALRVADPAFEFLVMERANSDVTNTLVGECRHGHVRVGDIFRSSRREDGSGRDLVRTVQSIELFGHNVNELPRGRGGTIVLDDSSGIGPGDVLRGERRP